MQDPEFRNLFRSMARFYRDLPPGKRKYVRVIVLFAEKAGISTRLALDYFYRSEEYDLIRRGVSDLHCMSDDYLAEDLLEEWNRKK